MTDAEPDILQRIAAHKQQEVAQLKQHYSVPQLQEQIAQQPPARGFEKALRYHIAQRGRALIAEIKKASPSKGIIRQDFNPAQHAADYTAGGASCLSILTDEQFFQGHAEHLKQARAATYLPCLRKDFIIDAHQVYHARAMGADCILLIMALLDAALAAELEALAYSLHMDVLIEVHDTAELHRALRYLKSPLIGINNRNLRTFATDIQLANTLAATIPADKLIVGESGYNTHADIAQAAAHGIKTFLVGESLMRQDNIAHATQCLLGAEA